MLLKVFVCVSARTYDMLLKVCVCARTYGMLLKVCVCVCARTYMIDEGILVPQPP